MIFMMLGPIRHTYTALERAVQQGVGLYLIPRYTRVVDNAESRDDINKAYSLISGSDIRNNMIVDDIKTCITNGRSPVILTRTKDHARKMAELLCDAADHLENIRLRKQHTN